MKNSEIYTAMLIGVAIFIGGMVTIIFLNKYLSSQPQTSFQQVTLKPVESKESISLLSDIKEEIKKEKPSGQVFNMALNVTDQLTDLYDQYRHKMPWSKVDITNNGPSPLFLCVNEWEWSQSPLQVGTSINVDFQQKDSIRRLFLKCDAGKNTNVSLYIVK